MNKTATLLTLALVLGTGSARAEDPGKIVLSGGLLLAQGSALDMTHKTLGGYALEAGYLFTPKDLGVDLQPYVGWQKLPGAEPTAERPTYELVGFHAGFDLIYRPWSSLPVTLSTGPSAHVWQVELKGQADGRQGDQGVKLGWRLGAAYDLNKDWSVGLKYTLTEWHSIPEPGNVPRRPAYFSLMASCRF